MKVLTAVVNNPIFIEIQNYTLKKYMKCDYEFIVFNDAKGFPDFSNGNNPRIKIIIEELCKKLDIKCINIPNEQHINEESACIRCANSMNFILERLHGKSMYEISKMNLPDKEMTYLRKLLYKL